MKNAAITKRDFDNAVKQEWNYDTCIIAQCMKRNGLNPSGYPGPYHLVSELEDRIMPMDAMNSFDAFFNNPGDEKKPELKKLRASLPIPINLPSKNSPK
jgi:hypothetical protein